jgi:hypothetical protein
MDNIKGGLGDKMEDWIKKLHQVDKQLQAQYCTIKNLQGCADARVGVVHRDTMPAIINQMLKVEKVSKRKFTSIKADKEGIKELRDEHWAKRMKALDDRKPFAKQSEYTLVLLGLKSSSKAIKTGGSTSKEGH